MNIALEIEALNMKLSDLRELRADRGLTAYILNSIDLIDEASNLVKTETDRSILEDEIKKVDNFIDAQSLELVFNLQ